MKYFALSLLFFSLACHAEIFMQLDKNGNAIYSDTPLTNDAKKIELPAPAITGNMKTTIVETKITTSPNLSKAPSQEIKQPYKTFAITSPSDQESIQNQPTLSVKISIEPELQQGDTIQVYLDGKARGTPVATTQIELGLVDRGTHQLSASLLDSNGQVLKQTSSITIFVHRVALGPASTVRPAGSPPP